MSIVAELEAVLGGATAQSRPVVCILGASFATNNLGVNALASGIINTVLHHFDQARMFFLNYGHTGFTEQVRLKDRTIPVEFVNARFSKTPCSNHIAVLVMLALALKVIPSERIRRRIVTRNHCLSRLSEADIVVSMAGGDSFSDIYGLRRFFYVVLPQILALVMNKRLVLLPQTIGPFGHWVTRRVARLVLRRADRVYSRDFAGQRVAQMLAGQKAPHKFRFCYDLGFLLDPIPPAHSEVAGLLVEKGSRPRVGLNVSGLLYVGGYTRKNMFGLKAPYPELVQRLIESLVGGGAEVLLVPHVFGTHLESDSVACQEIYGHIKDAYPGAVGYLAGKYDHNEIKHVIGTCDFFIGSRMHACIAALSQCVPTVAIAYSDKFAGVLETIGLPSLVIDARKTSADEVVAGVTRIYMERHEAGRSLRERIPEVVNSAMGLFGDIMDAPVASRPN